MNYYHLVKKAYSLRAAMRAGDVQRRAPVQAEGAVAAEAGDEAGGMVVLPELVGVLD